jgi:hypothetical protein
MVIRLCLILLLCAGTALAGPEKEGERVPSKKAPAKAPVKAPPVKVRDVPQPPTPDIQAVPTGFSPKDWVTWATGQDITGASRISILLMGGFGIPGSNMAGTGSGALKYNEAFEGGPSVLLEAGFALLPVLHITASFRYQSHSGQWVEFWDDETSTRYEMKFDDLDVFHIALNVKFKVPLLVWTLKKTHLRFSRATELTGVLLFFRAGAGLAVITDVGLEMWHPTYQYIEYWWSTENLGLSVGMGFEVRWNWGGVILVYDYTNCGQPGDAESTPNSIADDVTASTFFLGFALYL